MHSYRKKNTMDLRVGEGGKYIVGRKIGSGSFGDIRLGEWNLHYNEGYM